MKEKEREIYRFKIDFYCRELHRTCNAYKRNPICATWGSAKHDMLSSLSCFTITCIARNDDMGVSGYWWYFAAKRLYFLNTFKLTTGSAQVYLNPIPIAQCCTCVLAVSNFQLAVS